MNDWYGDMVREGRAPEPVATLRVVCMFHHSERLADWVLMPDGHVLVFHDESGFRSESVGGPYNVVSNQPDDPHFKYTFPQCPRLTCVYKPEVRDEPWSSEVVAQLEDMRTRGVTLRLVVDVEKPTRAFLDL